tara:strand:- start:297 stop:623 length:327 start_codon:yes stop_codon:yes gene_type:complete
MDISDLKSLLPILVLALTGLIALVKLSARVVELEKDLSQLMKNLEQRDTYTQHVKLDAKVNAIEKHSNSNISSLWDAHEKTLSKFDAVLEKIDQKYQSLREKINGGSH